MSGAQGVELAVARQLESHRTALIGHCYRMLGSVSEAEDAVQETMIKAWRRLDQFEGRSTVRTWLYRIATHVCLDQLSDRKRRGRPVELGPQGVIGQPLTTRPTEEWLEPIPDVLALPVDVSTEEQATLRQSIRLAFVAAVQHLPPRQRAALLLTEVLGWSAAEAAATLEMTEAAVNSALQRARATLATRDLSLAAPPKPETKVLSDKYARAFIDYDLDALTSLLHDDATLSMPPFDLWLTGHATIRRWLEGPGAPCRGSILVPVQANDLPAWAQYRPNVGTPGFHAWAILVIEPRGERIGAMNSYLDVGTLFPRFGLPLSM